MRKLISAAAVCAVAVGLVAVPNALGVKSAKQVGGTVSVNVTPNPLPDAVTTVTASGNVASNSSCRKGRTISFAWVNGSTVTPATGTATSGNNGDYTATVSRPLDLSTAASGVVLRATVAQTYRKVGSKKKGKKNKKGRQFNCLSFSGDSATVSLVPSP
jgi:hypothetical protein